MAKRKKATVASVGEPLPDMQAGEAAKQMNLLMKSMETYTKHKVWCWLCGEEDSTSDETDASYARWLYEFGWRYILSEKFNSAGVLCPDCAKTPDAERGE